MHPAPASPVPGPDGDRDPCPTNLPVGLIDWEDWLALDADEGEAPPEDGEEYLDPDGCEVPWGEDLAAIVAETDQVMAERAADAEYLARPGTAELACAVLADEARRRGPRGPRLPGSAERVPGVSSGPAGGFGAGECLDTAPGSAALHGFVERAVDSGRLVEDTAGMPEAYLDSAGAEAKWALAETRQAADQMLGLAWDLEVKLPGTKALFRDGRLRHSKVVIIARQTAALDAEEARQAEEQVLGQAPGLSPGRLRTQIKRAVARVNPKKTKNRREQGAKNARVERWAEDSGNAGLSVREAPPALVLAADQRITWWARQLQTAGIKGVWTCCAPGLPWTCSWTRTPGPLLSAARPRLRTGRITRPGPTGPRVLGAGRSWAGSRAGTT
ncbi:MAG TPA: DUF222 domain-containing protein [Streptosporangiaceae bacterium]|nr:DUF222 domain-containing protein [Streptosporangiaceae bacterium]